MHELGTTEGIRNYREVEVKEGIRIYRVGKDIKATDIYRWLATLYMAGDGGQRYRGYI